jgi:hypothetical protein
MLTVSSRTTPCNKNTGKPHPLTFNDTDPISPDTFRVNVAERRSVFLRAAGADSLFCIAGGVAWFCGGAADGYY